MAREWRASQGEEGREMPKLEEAMDAYSCEDVSEPGKDGSRSLKNNRHGNLDEAVMKGVNQ